MIMIITLEYLASQGLSADFPKRFWAKVDKRGPNECWICTATAPNGRYPHLKTGVNGKSIQASRADYILCVGPIPKGKIVRHDCTATRDFPACCNPRHLKLGTHKQNTHDALRKGTFKPVEALPGENNHRAKLTNQQVEEIRMRYATENISMKRLGNQYGIGAVAVFRYVHGMRYGSNKLSLNQKSAL